MGNIVVRFMNYMFPSDKIIYSNDLQKPINIKDNYDIYKENIIDYTDKDEDYNDVFISIV
jgi:hypothetical protein